MGCITCAETGVKFGNSRIRITNDAIILLIAFPSFLKQYGFLIFDPGPGEDMVS